LSGSRYGMMQVIENIIMLIPMGFMASIIETNKKNVLKTIILGFLFSLFIEISQYVRCVGLFEVDDLINNTLGVTIGCAIGVLFKRVVTMGKSLFRL